MPTYIFPEPLNVEIVDPVIEKSGVFGYRFINNVSGNYEGVINLTNLGGKVYGWEVSSTPENAPPLNTVLTDQERDSLIDAWILEQLIPYIKQ